MSTKVMDCDLVGDRRRRLRAGCRRQSLRSDGGKLSCWKSSKPGGAAYFGTGMGEARPRSGLGLAKGTGLDGQRPAGHHRPVL